MGTYTTNKNLFMPSVGETGWGDLVNGNFSTIDTYLKPISLSGSTYTFTGNQTGGSISATSISNSGTLTQTGTSTFTGKITANGGIGTKALTTTSISNSGTLTQTGTSTFTGKITANGGIGTKALTATTGTFSGAISGTTATFSGNVTAPNINKYGFIPVCIYLTNSAPSVKYDSDTSIIYENQYTANSYMSIDLLHRQTVGGNATTTFKSLVYGGSLSDLLNHGCMITDIKVLSGSWGFTLNSEDSTPSGSEPVYTVNNTYTINSPNRLSISLNNAKTLLQNSKNTIKVKSNYSSSYGYYGVSLHIRNTSSSSQYITVCPAGTLWD